MLKRQAVYQLMDVLSQIIASKRLRLAERKSVVSIERLREAALAKRKLARSHALVAAVRDGEGVNVIAEFKRRSPSKGTIRENADAATIARSYQSGGAAAISVLTEEDYFAGSLDDLRTIRSSVSLPILRKDFIVDEYQVYETAAAGADALLLIAAALDNETLARLLDLAEQELGLDALVEVHNEEELQRAIAVGAKLIGVNNRDLRTFEVSIETSLKLAALAPSSVVLVSESGLGPDDVPRLRAAGFNSFLIGESLMRAEDPERQLRAFRREGWT